MKENRFVIDAFANMLWLEHGLSPNTVQAYRKDGELFASWLDGAGGKSLCEASEADILGYLAHRQKQGAKASSTARLVSSLKRLFRYLVRESYVSTDPTLNLDSPRIGRKLPSTLTESEVENLLLAPDRATALGMRDAAMIDLMYSSGLRVSELVSLQLYQVHLSRGVIRVLGKGSKERIVPMAIATQEVLEQYLGQARVELIGINPSCEVCFPSQRGQQMTRQTFWHRIKRYASQIGVRGEVSPHTLRHAFATHLVNNGADLRVVQLLLGHSNLSTTQIYTHVAKQRLMSLHEQYHPRA